MPGDFDNMLRYCAELEQNNNRTWFHENHKQYERAVADFVELLGILKFAVAEAAPDIRDGLIFTEPKAMMYRIPRDARIHNGKPPYNPSFRAYISTDRKSMRPIGYFLRIAPNDCLFGTGLWLEKGTEVYAARRFMLSRQFELAGLLADNGLTVTGPTLKRMPAGFDENSPVADLLKMKEWFASVEPDSAELGGFDDFADAVTEWVRRMEPLRLFFMQAHAAAQSGELNY
ncbi:MAG: DUF2461 domain-containing protein [Oscillospiraceae bacterium]|nr:DUF2461 domain-containing protein [Oscillospiraceae bacterium]